MFKAVSTPLLDLKDWRFSVDQQGIAWAVFDREGESQNSLGRRPFEELGAIVQEAEQGAARPARIRGLVIIVRQGDAASSSAPTCASSRTSSPRWT